MIGLEYNPNRTIKRSKIVSCDSEIIKNYDSNGKFINSSATYNVDSETVTEYVQYTYTDGRKIKTSSRVLGDSTFNREFMYGGDNKFQKMVNIFSDDEMIRVTSRDANGNFAIEKEVRKVEPEVKTVKVTSENVSNADSNNISLKDIFPDEFEEIKNMPFDGSSVRGHASAYRFVKVLN